MSIVVADGCFWQLVRAQVGSEFLSPGLGESGTRG
jgi:hypothetical protein